MPNGCCSWIQRGLSVVFVLVILGGTANAAEVHRWSSSTGERLRLLISEADLVVRWADSKTQEIILRRLDSGSAGSFSDSSTAGGWRELRDSRWNSWEPSVATRSEFGSWELVLPPVLASVELRLWAGTLQVRQAQGNIFLQMQRGRVVLSGGSGQVQVHILKGDFQSTGFNGNLQLDFQAVNVGLRSFSGELEMEVFSGETKLEKTSGNLRLRQQQGSVNLAGGQTGTLRYEVWRANLSGSGLQGRIDGQSQQGSVQLALGSEAEVNLRSTEGRISVQIPASVPASLNLAVTEGGELSVPAPLRVQREGASKNLVSRLRSGEPKVSLFVRSKTGNVSVR